MRPARSLPTMRTRVASARAARLRPRPARASGEAAGASGCARLACTPCSVARTDHECARISSRSRSWSAGESSESSARAWPIVSRPARRSAWITSGSFSSRRQLAIAAPVPRDSLGELFLRPAELGEQPLVGFRLFHRVQVLAEQVLDQGQLEALARRSPHGSPQGCASFRPALPPASGARRRPADSRRRSAADDHGLQDAALLQGCR